MKRIKTRTVRSSDKTLLLSWKVNQRWKRNRKYSFVEFVYNWKECLWPSTEYSQADDAREEFDELFLSPDGMQIIWKQFNDRMTKIEDDQKQMKLELSELHFINSTKKEKYQE
eukprot:GFUD01126489.1.p1 GENE.GFUD01126489.1~~GFUD01126489.1.p1  ORF type:complete len:113 (-),score=19.15 GFUD01126489.1:2-340(-)